MYQGNTTFNTEQIDLHIRTYRSLLKSAGELKIAKLIDSHLSMNSMLHEMGQTDDIDIAAFIYVLLRLPSIMSNVKKIILGQSFTVFRNNGFENIEKWQEVSSAGRRRKMFYDGNSTLVVFIASVTDVDDLITLLTAFQIEWNKFHHLLAKSTNVTKRTESMLDKTDSDKIKNIWGEEYHKFITAIKHRNVDFTVKLLAGSYVEYAKSTQYWWNHIVETCSDLDITNRPIYFVSSNTHSIVNILTRFALSEEKKLIEFLHQSKNTTLIQLWDAINKGDFLANKENFLYYIAKKYAASQPEFLKRKKSIEEKLGIRYIAASHYLDIDTQIIELSAVANTDLGNKLKLPTKNLSKSRAVLINIDYPLGWAAYQVLTEIGQNVENVKGVYIMGKAATLNGNIGDILLPTTVFDQHTKNIYVIKNSFDNRDFRDIFHTGVVLDNQKTICAKGTFLESRKLIKAWYQEGYSIIEMEAGPFLNAAYEFVYYNRYTENQFINLTNTPFEIGIAHYASDTPYSKAKNLGVRNLSFEGVEPTYAISQAILKKIITCEINK